MESRRCKTRVKSTATGLSLSRLWRPGQILGPMRQGRQVLYVPIQRQGRTDLIEQALHVDQGRVLGMLRLTQPFRKPRRTRRQEEPRVFLHGPPPDERARQ